jgi:hypothetical protein
MELYGFTESQAQLIIEIVVQARDGLITEDELVAKLAGVIGREFEKTPG